MTVDGMDLELMGFYPVHVHVTELGTGQQVTISGDAAHPNVDDLPTDEAGRVKELPTVRVRLRQPVMFEGKRYPRGSWLKRNLQDVEWLS